MSNVSDRQLHLTFVQDAIKRMSQNSFALKGWCVGVVSVVLAYSAKDGLPTSLRAAMFPIAFLWLLDAYFVMTERAFRSLYDQVRAASGGVTDFSMTPQNLRWGLLRFVGAAVSVTVLPFYAALASVLDLIAFGQGLPSGLGRLIALVKV